MVHKPIPFATKNSSRSAQDPEYQRERSARSKFVSKGMARAKARRIVEAEEEDKNSLASSVVMPVKPASSPYPKKKAPDGVRRAISKANFTTKSKK